MKQFLARVLEFAQFSGAKLYEFGRWAFARLRAIEIDPPRGVAFCVALQLVVLCALMMFELPATGTDEPVPAETVETPAAQESPPADAPPADSTSGPAEPSGR